MSDSFVQLPPDGSGKKLDSELLAGGNHRERLQIAGALLAEIARVINTDPAGTDYGLLVRLPSHLRAVIFQKRKPRTCQDGTRMQFNSS